MANSWVWLIWNSMLKLFIICCYANMKLKKEDKMWILVYSKRLRFSALEFALITRLIFGNVSQFDLTSLKIRDKYFDGENKICSDWLEEDFISLYEKWKKMSTKRTKLSKKSNFDEDIIKLILLYFVEHVLLGKKGKNLIDWQWVQLIDSLEQFNKYPWGRICYERTLFGLQKALDKRISKYVKKKEMQPMKHVFQIWAYLVIPLLGMKYASRVGRSFPRILNWRGTAILKYTELQSLFLESNVSNVLIFFYICFFICITIFLLLTSFFLLWINIYPFIPYSFLHWKSMNKSIWIIFN